MRPTSLLCALVLCSSFAACGDESTEESTGASGDAVSLDVSLFDDTGVDDTVHDDAGLDSSDASVHDTGLPPEDTVTTDVMASEDGAPLGDTEEPTDVEAPSDISSLDGATSEDTILEDATLEDATLEDATLEDAAAEDTTDATVEDIDPGPVGENVLAQGSFEEWADGLPVGWLGDATNLSTDAISEESTKQHDGERSARLTWASGSHKRFSTAPLSLTAGKYACRYWVRGEGEIRNARYDDGYSSYSGYTQVGVDDWIPVDYDFNVVSDTSTFELVFSVRNTGESGLLLDHVRCVRLPGLCDDVTCESFEVCTSNTGQCETASGKCADDQECASWQQCNDEHVCILAPGACTATADCTGDTPVCDSESHQCVAGDPCAAVSCDDWQVCKPDDASCVPADGMCAALADCPAELPVCHVDSHTCEPVDSPANIVPNGGFEAWETVTFGGATETLLPVSWYGVCDGCSPYFPETEIAATNVIQYTTAPHSGTSALQLIDPTEPADRFVSEPFAVTPTTTYHCSYRVRGKGTYRHRGYCGGWNPDTEFAEIDSLDWQPVTFQLGGSTSTCVLILYASNTDLASDHIQFDDVICIAP